MVGFRWAVGITAPSCLYVGHSMAVPSLIVASAFICQATANPLRAEKRHAWKNLFQRDPALSNQNTNGRGYLRKTPNPQSPAPTVALTSSPTALPLFSAAPTPDPFPPVDPPATVDPTYFNYNTSFDAEYGPGYPQLVFSDATSSFVEVFQKNAWATREIPIDNYWREFDNATNGGFGPYEGTLAIYNTSHNRCEDVGAQSPIDLSENSVCYEHHQARCAVSQNRVLDA